MFNEVLARKPRRSANIWVWAPVAALGLFFGLALPTLTAAILYYVLGRSMRNARDWLVPAVAVAYSQAAWVVIPGLFNAPSLIILGPVCIIIAGLALWLHLSGGKAAPAVALIIAEVAFIALDLVGGVRIAQRDMFTAVRSAGAGLGLPVADLILLGLMLRGPRRPTNAKVATVFD